MATNDPQTIQEGVELGRRQERERVRFKLSTQEAFDEVFDAIVKNIDGGYAVAADRVLDAIAARLGIDLRQPAGKGENNGK